VEAFLAAVDLSDDVFVQVAAILIVSTVAGAAAIWLRAPLVIAFVVVGLVVGPSAAGLVEPGGELELLAQLGVALLLFVVGLKLDLHVIRRLGPVAVVAGGAQVAITAAGGMALALALGLSSTPAAYVGIGVAFSSTIIVVKLLSDRRELDDLHGRITLGILIVQDLVVVVAIAIVSGGDSDGAAGSSVATVVLTGVALVAVLTVLARYVLTPLLHRIARAPDLLVLFAIAWAIALGAAGEELGLGIEVGAFLGGVSLASTPYRDAVGSRLVTIRDFLLLFFFIDLGSRLELGELADEAGTAAVLAAFVLVVKPAIVMATLGALRYRKRVSLEAGLALAQVSEFSLILAAVGLRVGHIDESTATLLTAVALVTIAVSAYVYPQAGRIADRLGGRLDVFERRVTRPSDDPASAARRPDVVVLGLGRYGEGIVEGLRERGVSVLGVDFDPVALGRWSEKGVDVLYGDAEDPELPRVLPLPDHGWVVSTLRRVDANLALLHALGHSGYAGDVAVAAHHNADVARLTRAGAAHVLMPYAAAARDVVEIVTSGRTTSPAISTARAALPTDAR
jgi:Kef-type K+ transport system membrane component KefB